MTDEPVAVQAVDLSRVHGAGGARVIALDHVSLSVAAGETVAVVGPSGSGKSTLLFLLGGLDQPDSGRVLVAGTAWESLEGRERARFRRRNCGFVVQGMALLPQATAAENVEVPLLLDGVPQDQRIARVAKALDAVGLAPEADKLPDQLSGGQQQRVALARALVLNPAVILADEPTGNLDTATGRSVTELLFSAAEERGTAVVVVTHDPAVAARAHRTVALHSGRIHADEPDGAPG